MGFYGAVVRQWLDAGVKPWRTRLVGVEAWEAYRNPCWELYDRVEVRMIESYLAETVKQFDGILLLDTLEHFDREAGDRVLRDCCARLTAGGVLIVATPGVNQQQGAAHGNELERHRSFWTAAEVAAMGFAIAADGLSLDPFGHRMVIASRQP